MFYLHHYCTPIIISCNDIGFVTQNKSMATQTFYPQIIKIFCFFLFLPFVLRHHDSTNDYDMWYDFKFMLLALHPLTAYLKGAKIKTVKKFTVSKTSYLVN